MKCNLKQAYDYITNNVSINEIIGNYIELKKKGSNYVGLCPFHNDTNPSLSVSSQKKIFKCFSCNAKGNGVTFVRDFKKISLYDAVKEIIEILDLDLQLEEKQETSETSFNFDKFYECNLDFLKIAKYNFLENEKYNQTIFFKRKISLKTLKTLNCGYCDVSVINVLKKKQYDEKFLLDLNLILENGSPTFNNFYIFPIFNLNQKIVGFFGIPKVVKNLKYLNSKETPLFNKNEVLYNFNLAWEQKQIIDYIILVEGYFDVFSLVSCDLKNVAATMGTSLSDYCLTYLLKFSKVILSFDFDEAGQEFTKKVIYLLLKRNFSKILCIKYDLKAKDANEYLQKYNEEKLKKLYLEEPITWYEYLYLIWNLKNKNTPINEDFFQFFKPFIFCLNNLNKEIVIDFLSKKTKIDKATISDYFFQNKNFTSKETSKPKEKKVINIMQYQSFILSNCFFNDENKLFVDEIGVDLKKKSHNFLLTAINNNFFGKINNKGDLKKVLVSNAFYKNFFNSEKNILNYIREEYQNYDPKKFKLAVLKLTLLDCKKEILNLKNFLVNENNLLLKDILRINFLINLLEKKIALINQKQSDLIY
ncbi:toprim domain-containing protein [symbiont of Argiope bruennichi]|uniref:CHC2 zinc finger domain-containing protein n=1 Tax=symbiont of Argiope bruennichi TaxID=2810479 RepID=UPI003DA3BD3B